MIRRCFTTLVFVHVTLVSAAWPTQLSGIVVNQHGEPLPAVSVVTNVTGLGTITDAAGRFSLPDNAPIERVKFSSVGYVTREFSLANIPDSIVLQSTTYRGDPIIVTSDRAQEGINPIAFENMSRSEIERDYSVAEFPVLLQTTPNLQVYTDGGAPLGYAYTSIRGFDDKRITTYINGVPLNDPEWQQTYFTDLPDFGANIDDIQVQRGIGNSLYGEGSFGGTINVVTSALSRSRYAAVSTGYGEFTSGGKSVSDIYKQSIEYSSGLLDNRWHFGGRFSRQRTGGYRENSWYNGWSYYFSLARVDPHMTTELYVYGGPIQMHLAFYAAPRSEINQNRRFNPQTYSNETDNFNQPHYHLHNTYRINDRMTLSNTLYYIRGKGYFEQLAPGAYLADYGIDSLQVSIDTSTSQPFTTGNVVRQDQVHKNQIGWNPRFDYDHAKGRHSLGGSVYYFESNHFGIVRWAEHIDGGLDPQHQFYQWFGEQWVGSFFAEEMYRPIEKLTIQAAAQVRYERFDLDEKNVGAFLGHQFDFDWLFFSPRLGARYRLTDRLSLFTNFAIASRPPIIATIYDGAAPNNLPLLEIESVNSDSTKYTFGEPLITDERVYDFELGGNYNSEPIACDLNLFWMEFRHEILPYGDVNPATGLRSAVNLDRSVHAGVEFSASYRPSKWLLLDGNVSYNYNRVKDFSLVMDTLPVSFDDKKIAGFPDVIGNFVTDFTPGNARITHRLRFVGRRYVELENVEALSLGPYAVGDLSVSYTLKNLFDLGDLTVAGHVYNWADKKYESSGYGGNYAYDDGMGNTIVDGWAEYYTAAERWFYGELKMELF